MRVAVYGCGRWANRAHIPNRLKIDGADIVALCDVSLEALRSTADRFGLVRTSTYLDAHEMLAQEAIDGLWSLAPILAARMSARCGGRAIDVVESIRTTEGNYHDR